MNGKYLNAKVRCVEARNDKCFVVGTIYDVVDGIIIAEQDIKVFKAYPVNTIDEINSRLSSQFEIVEDDLINATLTTGKKVRLNKMTTDNFNAIISAQIDHCKSILCSKAKEYATADRLHNFKVAGALQGISPVQALMGMMAKHTVSVADMCMSGKTYPQELWDEKITDSINYLLLLSALVRESFGYNRCIYCDADYQPYAISPHEAQIKDCDKICKDCLVRMFEEKLREVNNERK